MKTKMIPVFLCVLLLASSVSAQQRKVTVQLIPGAINQSSTSAMVVSSDVPFTATLSLKNFNQWSWKLGPYADGCRLSTQTFGFHHVDFTWICNSTNFIFKVLHVECSDKLLEPSNMSLVIETEGEKLAATATCTRD